MTVITYDENGNVRRQDVQELARKAIEQSVEFANGSRVGSPRCMARVVRILEAPTKMLDSVERKKEDVR